MAWVPSHKKKLDWAPSLNRTSAIFARALNDSADGVAGDIVKNVIDQPRPAWERRRDALNWSSNALQWAKDVEELYRIWLAEGRKPNVAAFAGLAATRP